jgi:hypothetical protein
MPLRQRWIEVKVVSPGNAGENGVLLRDSLTSQSDNLNKKTDAIFEGAPILICPLIRGWGEE